MSAALATITAARDLRPEWMDQPGLDSEMHRRALVALGRINWWSRTDLALWKSLRRLAQSAARPLRVLDLACGGGDVLRSLARRARSAGVTIEWIGCDVSPMAIQFARRRAAESGLEEVRYAERDILGGGLLPECDAAICTLFLHHLTVQDAEHLLRRMSDVARRLVLVDDLLRTRTGYLLAWLAGQVLTRSPVVQADGPQSVRAAFSLAELRELSDRAGLAGATIQRHWPQRMLLTWERPA